MFSVQQTSLFLTAALLIFVVRLHVIPNFKLKIK